MSRITTIPITALPTFTRPVTAPMRSSVMRANPITQKPSFEEKNPRAAVSDTSLLPRRSAAPDMPPLPSVLSGRLGRLGLPARA